MYPEGGGNVCAISEHPRKHGHRLSSQPHSSLSSATKNTRPASGTRRAVRVSLICRGEVEQLGCLFYARPPCVPASCWSARTTLRREPPPPPSSSTSGEIFRGVEQVAKFLSRYVHTAKGGKTQCAQSVCENWRSRC